ncbi:protein ABHD11-like isoform X2 [Ctenocephalides felis]|uniref:protein ABHD11-like isoform X2 n=1 Tax=Ctenocephalides felis TaxID=7515 RepID=UPI000E6E2ABE|nr:protein ABHD11-like isoform X2 [Ctenocephalides felis]
MLRPTANFYFKESKVYQKVLQLRYFSAENDHSQRKESHHIETVRLAFNSYETTKSGDERSPLIIMHGLLGSKQNWNSISKAIHAKTNRKVISVDARNHGDSPHHKEHTYFHLAEDVKSLIENLGLKSATVLGHSMGGRAMMLLALKYPQLVSSLIVADISPVTASPNLKLMGKYFDIMRKVKINPKETLAQARQSADKLFAKEISEKSLRDFLITNLVRSDNGYGWRVNIDALDNNFARHVALFPEQAKSLQYRGPTVFVAGGNSDYIRHSTHHKAVTCTPEY